MKQAAIYARVSTSAQAENGTSLVSQRDACLTLASERGYHVPTDYIFLEDCSGADLERPKLERAREFVRSGAVQGLICYAVDRLARGPIHVGTVAEECAKHEVELSFVLEPLDNSPEGALIRYVKGYAAQIERERIKERTLRGKRSRARQGFLVQGTGMGIFGYRYIPATKKRAVYEPQAEVVRRIFDACVQGQSCYTIALGLNRDVIAALGGGPWYPLTVKRILTNPCYKGTTIFGKTRSVSLGGKRRRLEERSPEEWIMIPGATPPIVTEEVFEAAQRALAQPRRRRNQPSRKYALTGHVECECGAPMVGTCLNKTYRYYRCRSTWPTATRPKTCGAPYFRANPLEDEVWRVVREVLCQPELIVEEVRLQRDHIPVLEQEIARLRSSIRRLSDQERRLIRLFSLGQITEEYIVREVGQLKKTRLALEADLARFLEQRVQAQKLGDLSDQVLAFCSQVRERLEHFDFDEKRLVLQALQVRVVVGKDGARLFGAIPTNLATIERTSA